MHTAEVHMSGVCKQGWSIYTAHLINCMLIKQVSGCIFPTEVIGQMSTVGLYLRSQNSQISSFHLSTYGSQNDYRMICRRRWIILSFERYNKNPPWHPFIIEIMEEGESFFHLKDATGPSGHHLERTRAKYYCWPSKLNKIIYVSTICPTYN